MEIMIAIVIIGLLATITLPAFNRARMNSQNTRFFSDARSHRTSLEHYTLETGDFPEEAPPGSLPDGMQDYINISDFNRPTAIGGSWKIETTAFSLAVGAASPTASAEQIQLLDKSMDDGNVNAGSLRSAGGNYFLVLQP